MNTNAKKIVISLIIAIFIEIFICNSQELCVLFAKSKNVQAEYTLTEIQDAESYYCRQDIILQDLDFEVHNIRIYYEDNYGMKIKYCPFAQMYGHSEDEISFPSKRMIAKKDNTYINLRTEDIAQNIRIEAYNNIGSLKIEKIVINSTKLNINIYRIMIFFIITILAICMKNGDIYKEEYNPNSKSQKHMYYRTVIILCILLLLFYKGVFFKDLDSIFTKDTNFELMLMQTESFLNGQLHLLYSPDDKLSQLSNPYDYTARQNINYMWDTSYYNGNYYQYFTALPIILFVLPLKVLTGYYITTAALNIILLMLAIFLIAKLVKTLIDRYVNKISLFNLILAQLTAIIASNIILLSRGWLYEISELLGIISLISAILIILSIEKDSKVKFIKLILLGVLSAFLVISKPVYIIWYILIMPMLFKVLYEKNNNKINKEIIKKIIIYAIPIVIIAIIQMWYNYARYDSILEFGARYQLTIYDMNVLTSFSIPKLIKGFISYLVKFPFINISEFPFIFLLDEGGVTTSLGVITFEYKCLGLFVIPIFWALFAKNKTIQVNSKKEKELKNVITLIIIITVLTMLANILFAGMCEQYAVQYKVILVICSILILLKGLESKKISNSLFAFLCIASIIITLPISLNTLNAFLQNSDIDLVVYLRNMFEFWI